MTLLFFASVFFIGSYFMSNDEIPFSLILWKNLHYLIFPFQPEKITGSVLFDTLTCILTTEFFISAVSIVLAVASFVVLLWLLISYFIEKNAKKLSE